MLDGEFEFESRAVLLDMTLVHRANHDRMAAVEAPTKQDLGGSSAEFVRNAEHHGMFEASAPGERAVADHADLLVYAPTAQFGLRQEWMDLHLDCIGERQPLFVDFDEMALAYVADASEATPSLALQHTHRLPQRDVAWCRSVQQTEIDAIKIQAPQALLKLGANLARMDRFGRHFRGDKDRLAR